MDSKYVLLWTLGNDITKNLRERRFSNFKSERDLFESWNGLWMGSSLAQKPGGPILIKIKPEQMRFVPHVYFNLRKLSDELNNNLPSFDIFGIRSNNTKKFAKNLTEYSELLKEVLFTDEENLRFFLFSEDIIQNQGATIIMTRNEFRRVNALPND